MDNVFIYFLFMGKSLSFGFCTKMNLGLQKYFLGMLIKRGDMFY